MKKKNFKKLLVACLLAAMVCLALAACSGGEKFAFKDYTFTNTETPDADWRDLNYGDGMKVDGVLDEAVWNTGETWFIADGVTMTTKVFLGETGVFFGLTSDDPWVYYNTNRTVYMNTSMELYVSAENGALNKDTVQLRYGANGYTEQWVGIHSTVDSYEWTRAFIPNMSRVKINGELNTPTCEGYVIETFMPYSALGLTVKPDKLYVYSAFNRANNNNDENNRVGWFGQSGSNNQPSSYYCFTEGGYTGVDVEGALVGDAPGYPKSAGWDLTYAADEEEPIVSTVGSGDQVIYFKNLSAQRYVLSAYIERDRAINDPHPKAGFLAAENAKGRTVALFDVEQLYTKDLIAVTRPTGGDWNWPGMSRYNGGINYSAGQQKAKLTVVRYNTMFYYFVNDVFMYKLENTLFSGEDTVAGLYTMGCAAHFTDLYASTDEAEAAALIASVEMNDTTKNWQGLGDFDIVSETAVTLKPGSNNVGGTNNLENGQRYIRKSGVTLTGDFELDFTAENLTFSEDIPDWMNPYLSARLYRVGTDQSDAFMIHAMKLKNIQWTLDGNWNTTDKYPEVDFTKKHTYTLIRTVLHTDYGDASRLTLYLDDQKLGEFISKYLGDYEYGFSSNYVAGELSAIYGGPIRNRTVTVSAGSNGTAAASSPTAPYDSSVTITVTPAEGYAVSTFTVDGIDKMSLLRGGKAEITVFRDTAVDVTFAARSTTKQTVTGTVTTDAGTMADVTAMVYDASAEYPLTLDKNGAFTKELSEGVYTLSVKHSDEHMIPFSQTFTLDDKTEPFAVTLKVIDPIVNGELDDFKAFYYSDARKMTIDNEQGKMDFYVYFGSDGFYLMADVTDGALKADKTLPDSDIFKNDNVEMAFTVGELTDKRIAGKNFHFLLSLDGRAWLDSINETGGRFGDSDNISKKISREILTTETGYRMEIKLTYALFGLTAAPETFAIAPAYVDVDRGGFKCAKDINYDRPYSYYSYNKTALIPTELAKDQKIDGDIADWADSLPEFSVPDLNNTGMGMKYKAYKGTDGVYAGVTLNYNDGTTGKANWFENPNIEIWFGDMQTGIYLTNTAGGWGVTQAINNFLQGAVKTTDRGADRAAGLSRYSTTFEFFFSYKTIPIVCHNATGDRIAFAGRSFSDKIKLSDSLKEEIWWRDEAHKPNTVGAFYLYEDGLYASAKA